jgi:hypothetical protein
MTQMYLTDDIRLRFRDAEHASLKSKLQKRQP